MFPHSLYYKKEFLKTESHAFLFPIGSIFTFWIKSMKRFNVEKKYLKKYNRYS